MSVLGNLEPKKVFGYFEEICNIPHGSFDTKRISDYLVDFAKERNLTYYQDEFNNVIIIKEATEGYEDADPIIIQGHVDMVCEKKPDLDFDFKTQGLNLMIDGDFITADGTTLGGDDGIAVAMGLSVLDSDDLKHPRIEAVFTTDEEVGLIGAENIDLSPLKGKKLINIDSELEGIFITSCAGGICVENHIPLERANFEGVKLDVLVSGLLGGHSGISIHEERGNGNTIMTRVLYRLSKEVDFSIVSLAGGQKDNAICNQSKAELVVAEKDLEKAVSIVEEMDDIISHEYQTTDPKVKITCTKGGKETVKALSKESVKTAIIYLMAVPQGVQNMSKDIEGLVETSLNMGVLRIEDDELKATYAVRSSVETRKDYIVSKLDSITIALGGTSVYSGDYPGWEFKADSELRDTAVEVFKNLYGKEPKIEAIHAGLECGLFAGKIGPELDCISIGPDMADVHTYEEKLSIPSTKRVWEFLVELLAASK